MPQNLSESAVEQNAFDLKASSFTLPLLRLLVTDMDAVAGELAGKVAQAPEFFRNTPVVIDLQALKRDDETVDFALLVGLLRGYGMIPIGVRGGGESQHRMAEAMELAVLSERGVVPRVDAPLAAVQRPRVATDRCAATKLVGQPVRSGQRIYAAGGDLVITASVSSGAEVLADGNIHVYGALRGRALAGVKGNRASRIFCSDLQAELVSIAGHYVVSERIDEQVRGRPVQILLSGTKLRIEAI